MSLADQDLAQQGQAAMDGLKTLQKCLKFNLDPDMPKFGTFSEIGAAQEVARNFFLAGGASRTIAKSLSAYDKGVSDAIYGHEKDKRYVTRQRLEKMLAQEYDELLRNRPTLQGGNQRFFAFADTVAARAYSSDNECHGWMGVKAQLRANAEPSTVVLHVKMLDGDASQQADAIGIVGVNLLVNFFYKDSPQSALRCLLDNVGRERIEIDLCHFTGPDFDHVDPRAVSLYMLVEGLTNAVVFGPGGKVSNAQEAFYKKDVLVAKGDFRPITNITIDCMRCSRSQFLEEHPEAADASLLSLAELSTRGLNSLTDRDGLDTQDFLDRIDLLCSEGFTVAVTDFKFRFDMRKWIARYTTRKICFSMNIFSLYELFAEDAYAELEGGLVEAMGKLFAGKSVRLYVYPSLDSNGNLITADTAIGRTVPQDVNEAIAPHLSHFYQFLLERRSIVATRGVNQSLLSIDTRSIVPQLQHGDGLWENSVPTHVVKAIKSKRLFGYSRL